MNSTAVRALRKKFILIAMLSFGGVIFFLVTLLNVANHFSTRRDIRSVLESLADDLEEMAGEVEGVMNTASSSGEKSDSSAEGVDPFRESTNDLLTLLNLFDDKASRSQYVRLSRGKAFFAVFFDAGGEVFDILPDDLEEQTAATVITYARKAYENGSDFGNYGTYYYLLHAWTQNRSFLVFSDCSTQINALIRLLYASIIICLGILVLVFWAVYYLSDQMIQPEIRNIERQKQFITNASHELKTPLAVIRANTELIELMSGENEWTASTLRQVDRMNGLIKNLVTIARAEEKADKSVMAEIDVFAVVKDTADTFAPVAAQDGKEMVQELEENVRLVADEATVRQLASLLLDNAIKYCDEGGRVVVQLARIKKGRGIRLSVSNSYAAGESVDYSRFFERFYREDSSHNTEKGGYGIGLSIAESIVRSYNGTISANWKNGMISFNCTLA